MKSTVKDVRLNESLSLVFEGAPRESRSSPLDTKGRRCGFLFEVRQHWVLFAMITPAIVYFLIQAYLPMAGAYLAFVRFDFLGGIFGSKYIGLENFKYLFGSGILWHLTWNTLAFNIAFIVVSVLTQLSCALVLHRVTSSAFRRTVELAILLPYFMSFVAIGAGVGRFLDYDKGAINTILVALGAERVDLYAQPDFWPLGLVILFVWKNLGYGVIIYMAALSGLEKDFYDSAKIDGARWYQEIGHITLPFLTPVLVMLVLFNLSTILRGQFELFYQVVGNNGPVFDATDILDTYVYRFLIRDSDVGMGTAAGLYQSLFSLAVIIVVNRHVRRSYPEYALF